MDHKARLWRMVDDACTQAELLGDSYVWACLDEARKVLMRQLRRRARRIRQRKGK